MVDSECGVLRLDEEEICLRVEKIWGDHYEDLANDELTLWIANVAGATGSDTVAESTVSKGVAGTVSGVVSMDNYIAFGEKGANNFASIERQTIGCDLPGWETSTHKSSGNNPRFYIRDIYGLDFDYGVAPGDTVACFIENWAEPEDDVPPTTVPPTTVPPTTVPPTTVPPTTVPPTSVPQTTVPPTSVPQSSGNPVETTSPGQIARTDHRAETTTVSPPDRLPATGVPTARFVTISWLLMLFGAALIVTASHLRRRLEHH